MQRHVYKAAAHEGQDIERSPLLASAAQPNRSQTLPSTLPSQKSSALIRILASLAALLFAFTLIKHFAWPSTSSSTSLTSPLRPQPNVLFPSSLDPTILVAPDVAELLRESDTNSTFIPDIVHFIIGSRHSSRDGKVRSKPEFSLLNYLSIKSAADVLQANEIYCHILSEPEGEWWTKAKQRCTRLVPTRTIDSIFGRVVTHRQHQSTLLKLEALLQYGGIGADLDVLFTRTIKSNPDQYQLYFQLPLLLSFAMSSAINWYDRFDVSIVAARPGHPFIREWLTAYKHFIESSTEQIANEANHKVAILTHDLNRFSHKLVWDLHTLRPHYAYALPNERMPGWGQPYAAEPAGQTMLYDPQTITTFIELETQIAVHCWQGENEQIVEQFDESGHVKLVTSRYANNLYDKFLLRNTQDVCNKAETTNYGRVARIALLAARPGTTPAHKC